MSKFYEKTKSDYSKDIDHLVTFNKNGLWIKEKITIWSKNNIMPARPEGKNLLDVTIFHISESSDLKEKIISKKVNIENNMDLRSYFFKQKLGPEKIILKNMKFSIYDFDKINSLFKNLKNFFLRFSFKLQK